MKVRLLILFVTLMAITGGLSAPVQAQTTPERRLQVSPLRNEITTAPGAAYKGSLSLKNTGVATLKVALSAETFGVINEQYDYTFNPHSPVNDWVHFTQQDIIIGANETYIVHYLISVPIGAEPGGKYISLFASALPLTSDGINSTARVGSLVYLTVPGDITQPGELVSLKSPIVTTDSFSWSAVLRNGGTAHFRSSNKVQLQTLWNTNVAETDGSNLVLPASLRLIQGALPNPSWLGIYKVNYSFGLGDNPQANQTKILIYLPLLQTSIVLAGLLAAIIIVTRRIRRTN